MSTVGGRERERGGRERERERERERQTDRQRERERERERERKRETRTKSDLLAIVNRFPFIDHVTFSLAWSYRRTIIPSDFGLMLFRLRIL